MKEIDIEFEYKNEKKKYKFLETNELFEIYVFCAKNFKCGIFDLFYNEINLRFVDKNYKLNQIIKENNNHIIFKIIPDKKNIINEKNKKIYKNKKLLFINKGDNSNIILSNNLYTKNINYINLIDENIQENDLYSIFTYLSDKKIKILEISPKNLELLSNFFQFPDIEFFKNLKILKIVNKINNFKLINNLIYQINNLIFFNLNEIYIENCNVKFEYDFYSLKRINLINSFLKIINNQYFFENVEKIFIQTNFIENLYKILNEFKDLNELKIIKIKLDSLDINILLNINELLNHNLFLKSKEIYLNLKGKFILENYISEKICNKIIELKLLPYNNFNENNLNKFQGLNKLILLKINNYEINNNFIDNFIQNIKTLKYIDLGDININSNYHINKLYKLISYNKEIISTDIFKNINHEKLLKIELSCIEYNKKNKNLYISGDLLNEYYNSEKNNKNKIDESFFIFLKNLIFDIPILNKIVIKNFEDKYSIEFLNKFLLNFMNIIYSPKIQKLKIINCFVNEKLIEKFSFILMNSINELNCIEINNVFMENNQTNYLFYTLLFQIEYNVLKKIKIKNIKFDFSQILYEFNILNNIEYFSLESIENFESIFQLLKNVNLKGIELKNIFINENDLFYLLKLNSKNYEYISLDLDLNEGEKDKKITVFDIFNEINDNFENLKILKLSDSFLNYTDKKKLDFLENNWNKFRKLKFIKIFLKIISDKYKIVQQRLINEYKYLKNFIKQPY